MDDDLTVLHDEGKPFSKQEGWTQIEIKSIAPVLSAVCGKTRLLRKPRRRQILEEGQRAEQVLLPRQTTFESLGQIKQNGAEEQRPQKHYIPTVFIIDSKGQEEKKNLFVPFRTQSSGTNSQEDSIPDLCCSHNCLIVLWPLYI